MPEELLRNAFMHVVLREGRAVGATQVMYAPTHAAPTAPAPPSPCCGQSTLGASASNTALDGAQIQTRRRRRPLTIVIVRRRPLTAATTTLLRPPRAHMHDHGLVVVFQLEVLDDRAVVDTDQPFPHPGRTHAASRTRGIQPSNSQNGRPEAALRCAGTVNPPTDRS